MSLSSAISDVIAAAEVPVSIEEPSKPEYKLTYFPIMALAEPIRWLLSYGDLPFEDIRISKEEWEMQKGKTPFGMLPTLEVDGKVMHQSLAICRYLSNLVGLAGENVWENFEIDMAIDSISDFRSKISEYNRLPDNSEERTRKYAELLNESIPFYMTRLEQMAQKGYLANGKLSWADIYFTAMLDYTCGVLKLDVLDSARYQSLDKIRNEVRDIPQIKKWIEIRPISEY